MAKKRYKVRERERESRGVTNEEESLSKMLLGNCTLQNEKKKKRNEWDGEWKTLQHIWSPKTEMIASQAKIFTFAWFPYHN